MNDSLLTYLDGLRLGLGKYTSRVGTDMLLHELTLKELKEKNIYPIRADGLSLENNGILLVGASGCGKSSICSKLVGELGATYFIGETEGDSEFGLIHYGSLARVFPIIQTDKNKNKYRDGFPIQTIIHITLEDHIKPELVKEEDINQLYGFLGAELIWSDDSKIPDRIKDMISTVGQLNLNHLHLINAKDKLDDTVELVKEFISIKL
jgi:hypothetical protein